MNKKKDFTKEIYSYLGDKLPSLKEIYEQKVQELGLTQRQVERILVIDKKALYAILDKNAKRVDVSNLIKLGNFLDLDFGDALKIFTASLPFEQISELEKSRRASYIAENFDIKSLKKINFIENINDFDKIEEKIKTFFNLESIYDYTRDVGTAFSRTKKSYNNKMLDFWVQSSYSYFQKINNENEYKRNELLKLLGKIRPYSQNVEKGLKIVSQALYALGITVIYQPSLPTTQVRGATFIINDKPCIILTNLNKNYATLWFALLHELYHVLFDFEDIATNIYHLTGELELFLMNEERANNFARDYFLSVEKSKYIFQFIQNHEIVKRYAEKNQIHYSFVYNFYCYEQQKKGNNYWGRFNKYIHKTELALKDINNAIWKSKSINDSVQEAKKISTK